MAKSDFDNGRIARLKERERLGNQTFDLADTIGDLFTGGLVTSGRSNYNPPSDSEAQNHYDEGWNYEKEQNG